jgi:hypothetical protein
MRYFVWKRHPIVSDAAEYNLPSELAPSELDQSELDPAEIDPAELDPAELVPYFLLQYHHRYFSTQDCSDSKDDVLANVEVRT